MINSTVLKEQLLVLFEFQKYWFEQLMAIQQSIEPPSSSGEDFSRYPQGHLVKMTCGHRGIPCRTEEKRVSRLLRKSGFIPMLDSVASEVTKTYVTFDD